MTMPLLALLIWMQAGHPDTVRVLVLVNVSQPVTNISSADLRSIYVGQTTRWPSHRLIVPIVMPLDTAAGTTFLRRVIGMGEVDFAQHWIGLVFRGQTTSPPLVARSSAEAARFVATHPEAIALVTSMPAERNVRVLSVDGQSPQSAGYPLRW